VSITEIYEHNPGDHEDPVPGPTWIIGFLGAVLLVVIMLGITALYYTQRKQENQQKVVLRDPDELVKLHKAQARRLGAPAHWEVTAVQEEVKVDGKPAIKTTRSKSLVIPIELAMQRVIAEASRGGDASGTIAIGSAEVVSTETKEKPAEPGAGGTTAPDTSTAPSATPTP